MINKNQVNFAQHDNQEARLSLPVHGPLGLTKSILILFIASQKRFQQSSCKFSFYFFPVILPSYLLSCTSVSLRDFSGCMKMRPPRCATFCKVQLRNSPFLHMHFYPFLSASFHYITSKEMHRKNKAPRRPIRYCTDCKAESPWFL